MLEVRFSFSQIITPLQCLLQGLSFEVHKLCCSSNWKKSLNCYLTWCTNVVLITTNITLRIFGGFLKKRDSNMTETIAELRSVNLLMDTATLRMANIDTKDKIQCVNSWLHDNNWSFSTSYVGHDECLFIMKYAVKINK